MPTPGNLAERKRRAESAERLMRIAVIERFAEASRNCDPNRIGADGDDLHFLRLGGSRFRPSLLWHGLRSLGGVLSDRQLSSSDKRQLLSGERASTGGAPFAALASAHHAIRMFALEAFRSN